jgi:hypothetical protein
MQGNDEMNLDYNSRLRQVKSRRMNGLSAKLLDKPDPDEGRHVGVIYNGLSRVQERARERVKTLSVERGRRAVRCKRVT